MAETKIAYTITYRKPGTTPPIYVAGSFSSPEWKPTEMQHSTDDDGEHTFRSQVMVEPGKEYQFKIRIGDGDWWILAENYATATDASGNLNNLLVAPPSDSYKTPHEAGDSAVKARKGSPSRPQVVVSTNEDGRGEEFDLKTPLFAHECIGAYEFADTDSDDHDVFVFGKENSRRDSRPVSKDFDADIDVNDPTIEKFPSDRGSILDAIRSIQTHLDEDRTHVDVPSSPRVVTSRRDSVDSLDETNDHLSLSPMSPTASRRRDSRLSHSSTGRSRSAVSLGSIAEEPKPGTETDQKRPKLSPSSPKFRSSFGESMSPSEADEAVVMTSSEVTPNDSTDKGSLSQIQSIDSLNDSLNDGFVLDAGSMDETEPPLKPVEFRRAERDNVLDQGSSERIKDLNSKPTIPSSSDPVSPDGRSRDADEGTAKPMTTAQKLFGSLFSLLFGNKMNLVVATGAAALAIGFGWWKGLSKHAIDTRAA